MQAVIALVAKAGAAVASGAHAVSAAAGTAGVLQAAKFGTTAISAISGYAMSQRQADAYRQEAETERLAASQDFLKAFQTSNGINQDLAGVTGAQDAAASAMGVDIASGSVRAARAYAQAQADRQLSVVRTDAATSAAQRRLRAAQLDAAAAAQGRAGLFGAFTKIAGAGLDWLAVGGPTKGKAA